MAAIKRISSGSYSIVLADGTSNLNITAGNVAITGNLTTSGSQVLKSSISGTNITTLALDFSNGGDSLVHRKCIQDVTVSYSNVQAGRAIDVVIQNATSANVTITLPNAHNNLKSNNFSITQNTVASMRFLSFDTTSGNVSVSINNS
jgi:hypothetical protein